MTDVRLRLRADHSSDLWRAAVQEAGDRLCLPEPDTKALDGLKFKAALPGHFAEQILAACLADLDAATRVLAELHRITALPAE